MFTGIVEEIGTVKDVRISGGAKRLTVRCEEIVKDLKIDDSIAVDGVCLTTISISGPKFQVEAVEETIRKTNLSRISSGAQVNLERSLRFSDRLGGHLVQGHVDGVGQVSAIGNQAGGILLSVLIPARLANYVIAEGSITINGVSLTVARLAGAEVTISLIPHTLAKTNLGTLKIGDQVNIEVDLIAKYVEKLLGCSEQTEVTENWLRKAGYDN